MMFLATKSGEAEFKIGVGKARLLTSLALVGYPFGAALVGFGPDQWGYELVGMSLITIAFFATLFLMGSSIQRIVGAKEDTLDEYELKLRYRAISTAYGMMVSAGMLAILGLQMVHDWTNTNLTASFGDDHFNGFFWGLLIYALLLPTAVLAWSASPADLSEADDEDE
jgi:hypothetical protein